MSRNPQAGMSALPAVCAVDLRQDVGGHNGAAQRANRRLPYFFNVISAAGWTGRNFPGAGELEEICQVIWEPDGVTIGQAIFQGKRIGGGINLAEVIDTRIDRWSRSRLDKIRHDHQNEESQAKNKTSFCQKGV